MTEYLATVTVYLKNDKAPIKVKEVVDFEFGDGLLFLTKIGHKDQVIFNKDCVESLWVNNEVVH